MHGMCRTAVEPRTETSTPLIVQERDASERLTDADRQEAADLLSAAFRDGVIGVDELDERLTAALSARTAGDLEQVTGDLPSQWLADRQAAEHAERRAARHRRRWRAGLRTYARVMALLVTIWLLTSLDGDVGYPWPIWPALGWGIPLFLSRPRGPAARKVRQLRTARDF